jgi:hypothetical protein
VVDDLHVVIGLGAGGTAPVVERHGLVVVR